MMFSNCVFFLIDLKTFLFLYLTISSNQIYFFSDKGVLHLFVNASHKFKVSFFENLFMSLRYFLLLERLEGLYLKRLNLFFF